MTFSEISNPYTCILHAILQVIRADCFPLKGSLFYKGAVGEHWSLAQVIGTKGGKLIIADSKESDKVAELSPDTDSLMPMCLCAKLTAATIYLGTGKVFCEVFLRKKRNIAFLMTTAS